MNIIRSYRQTNVGKRWECSLYRHDMIWSKLLMYHNLATTLAWLMVTFNGHKHNFQSVTNRMYKITFIYIQYSQKFSRLKIFTDSWVRARQRNFYPIKFQVQNSRCKAKFFAIIAKSYFYFSLFFAQWSFCHHGCSAKATPGASCSKKYYKICRYNNYYC